MFSYPFLGSAQFQFLAHSLKVAIPLVKRSLSCFVSAEPNDAIKPQTLNLLIIIFCPVDNKSALELKLRKNNKHHL